MRSLRGSLADAEIQVRYVLLFFILTCNTSKRTPDEEKKTPRFVVYVGEIGDGVVLLVTRLNSDIKPYGS